VATDRDREVGMMIIVPEELGSVVDTILKLYETKSVRVAGESSVLTSYI
jgi:hypothetical protein